VVCLQVIENKPHDGAGQPSQFASLGGITQLKREPTVEITHFCVPNEMPTTSLHERQKKRKLWESCDSPQGRNISLYYSTTA